MAEMVKEAVNNDKKKTTYEDMSEIYQAAYKAMSDAYEDFKKDVLPNLSVGRKTLETTYLTDEIKTAAGHACRKFRHVVPEAIRRGKADPSSEYAVVTEEYAVKKMRQTENTFRWFVECEKEEKSGHGGSKFSKLLRITDARAFLFEGRTAADQAMKLCRLCAKIRSDDPDTRLLTAIFGERPEDNYKRVEEKAESIRSYLDAVNDFSESDKAETDSLPDAVFEKVDLACILYTQLSVLSSILMLGRTQTKKTPEMTVNKMKQRLGSFYQITTAWKIVGVHGFGYFSPDKMDDESRERETLWNDVLDEMYDIRTNKDNFTGYHVNHVTSGETRWWVWGKKFTGMAHEDGKDIECYDPVNEGPFMTRAEAEKKCGEIESSFPEDDNMSDAFVADTPSDEFFCVIRNADGRKAVPCMFPGEQDALAGLYMLAKPAAFTAYEKYMATHKKEAEGDD